MVVFRESPKVLNSGTLLLLLFLLHNLPKQSTACHANRLDGFGDLYKLATFTLKVNAVVLPQAEARTFDFFAHDVISAVGQSTEPSYHLNTTIVQVINQ